MKTKSLNASTKDTLIFDLAGVLFKESRAQLLAKLGLWPIFNYVCLQRKNPVTTLFATLQEISKSNDSKHIDILYKGHILPTVITQWQMGIISDVQVQEMLTCYVEQLA